VIKCNYIIIRNLSRSYSDADRVSCACILHIRETSRRHRVGIASGQVERVKVNDHSVQRKIPPSPAPRFVEQLSRARSKNPRWRKFVYERATGGINRPNIFERVAPTVNWRVVKGVRLCYVCKFSLSIITRTITF